MTDVHVQFMEDPEANASHLEQCAECRAMFAQLDAPVPHQPVAMSDLPLAAWEGASYRSWGFIAVTSLLLLGLAVTLTAIAGVSPLRILTLSTSINDWRILLAAFSNGLRHAALGWQIVFGVAFIAVNSLLFVLLRRPPRGIDA